MAEMNGSGNTEAPEDHIFSTPVSTVVQGDTRMNQRVGILQTSKTPFDSPLDECNLDSRLRAVRKYQLWPDANVSQSKLWKAWGKRRKGHTMCEENIHRANLSNEKLVYSVTGPWL